MTDAEIKAIRAQCERVNANECSGPDAADLAAGVSRLLNELEQLRAEVERLRLAQHQSKFERDSAVAELIRVRRIYGDSVLGVGCSDEQIDIALGVRVIDAVLAKEPK